MGDDSGLSEKRTLCVAQYWRGHDSNASSSGKEHSDQVDHWGTCYQAIGNIDTLTYSCIEDECMEILAEGYRGCLAVGEIDVFSEKEIGALLRQVTVYRGRENWNCQNWVLAALERLKASNHIASNISRDGVRNELEDIPKRLDRMIVINLHRPCIVAMLSLFASYKLY
ncbi:uncharacterized protein F5891DRAFT_694665 [Suillus fuscotomentosus]|uniref:Uncharacterized protein n=1 Tax=Suillus fuscotomentosus TaxID=1912939 RepID=A0AAD4HQZ1_9AGAM|nr:uncharacterized protein F5891DRAFT_694665 [Suillus fuscotomentosus]KAG1905562.1 hypothetical protein F5891DRAFT_694665 [Suillus fuscotomentosus]